MPAALALPLLWAQSASAEQSGLGSAGARGARWQQGTVSVSVEDSVGLLGDQAFEAVVMAASAWQESPGALPTLVIKHGPEDPIGYRRSGPNRNTVRYSPDGDPLANGALAITVITFDAQAKRILDADIVLNGEHSFGFFDEPREGRETSKYDLQNVLTHELGHLLGLGEDLEDESATMYAFSQPGEIGKRDLEEPDIDSISSLYSEAFIAPEAGGCGGATIAGYAGQSWIWMALGLGGLGFLMRRRSTRQLVGTASCGVLLLTLVGSSSSAPDDFGAGWLDTGAGAAVEMTVTGTESAWQGTVIVTRLSLSPASGVGPELKVDALGGRVDDLVQVVGHALPPRLGERLEIDLGEVAANGSGAWLAHTLSNHSKQ